METRCVCHRLVTPLRFLCVTNVANVTLQHLFARNTRNEELEHYERPNCRFLSRFDSLQTDLRLPLHSGLPASFAIGCTKSCWLFDVCYMGILVVVLSDSFGELRIRYIVILLRCIAKLPSTLWTRIPLKGTRGNSFKRCVICWNYRNSKCKVLCSVCSTANVNWLIQLDYRCKNSYAQNYREILRSLEWKFTYSTYSQRKCNTKLNRRSIFFLLEI